MNKANERYTTMEKSGSVEDLRKLRLRALLRDLVREEGRMEAAELLGVNYKTVARTIESGDLSRRMSDALERLMLTGGVPAVARQGERIDDLERGMQGLDGRVEALEKEMRGGFEKVMAAVEGRAGVLREQWRPGDIRARSANRFGRGSSTKTRWRRPHFAGRGTSQARNKKTKG